MRILPLLFLAACAAPLAQADTLVHAARLIDGTSAAPREAVTVVVRGNAIAEVVDGYREPGPDDSVIELKSHTLMPGWIDLHTHLASDPGGTSRYLEEFTLDEADFALRAAANARRTLKAGFTTIRNLGDDGHGSIALRRAITAGELPGPRIYTAGKAIGTTGGHADPTNGWREDLAPDPGPREGVINGPYEARHAVRQRYKEGADLIKLTVTGGVLSLARSPDNPQFYTDELEAIVSTAHDYGMKVAVHAHGAEGMKRAIRAGVDTVEHGTYMDAEAMKLMKQHGTWYVPTLSAARWVGDHADSYPAIVQPKARAIGAQLAKTFAEARRNGVRIAFGTDAGVYPHGQNAKEFEYLVEAGMPALEAIRAATAHAAEALGEEKRLGTVESGKLADLVAVEGDPLADIGVVEKVAFVMKDGVVQ